MVIRVAAGAAVAVTSLVAFGVPTAQPAGAGASLSITISGDHFVNQAGETVRLLGVNVPSTEYACEEGWGYASVTSTPTADAAEASAIAAWGADAVRVPLNEDCWLGINGQPSYGTEAGYHTAIEDWVGALNADGIYAILDLHWSAPGTVVANGQRPMPDDHSTTFWTSVATTFKTNPAVVFDVFNEPYSPATDGFTTWPVTWSCWLNGGCTVPDAKDGTTPDPSETYTAVGMQTLITAIRATGADQPVMVGGLAYANDLSGWLAHEPKDPDGQLAASFHNYDGERCDTTICWNADIAPIAAVVPVVTGEFDQGYDCEDPPASDGFDNTFMDWADTEGVSYLAWGFYNIGGGTTLCSALPGDGTDEYSLIDATGNPIPIDGQTVHAHLLALAQGGGGAPATGYDLVGSDGGVFVFNATGQTGGYFGSLPGIHVTPAAPVVGLVPTATDKGYFLVGDDGGVFAFGTAPFLGSLPGKHVTPSAPIVGIVAADTDKGYFLVGRDGGVFAFGTVPFLGSLPGKGISVDNVIGIAATPSGNGYWLVEATGKVSGFGAAQALGTLTGTASPVSAIAGTPTGGGYWVTTQNGTVKAFGNAMSFGTLPALHVSPSLPVIGIVHTAGTGGYWLIGSDGGVFAFGNAGFVGSLPGAGVHVTDIVGAVPN